MCQWSLTYNESDILQTRDILLRHMIYHILMLNCEFESPTKPADTPVGNILSWLLCGFFFVYFLFHS